MCSDLCDSVCTYWLIAASDWRCGCVVHRCSVHCVCLWRVMTSVTFCLVLSRPSLSRVKTCRLVCLTLHPRYYASLVLAMVRCLSVSVLVTNLCFIEMCEQFELVFDLHTNLSIFFRHTLTVLLPYLIKLVTWEEYPVWLTYCNKVRWQYSWNVVGNALAHLMLWSFLIITEKEWWNSPHISQSYGKKIRSVKTTVAIFSV